VTKRTAKPAAISAQITPVQGRIAIPVGAVEPTADGVAPFIDSPTPRL
jgi:hypothetical protein